MNERVIDALVDLNYPVLLGFELHEKQITWEEYLKKISEWKMKKRDYLVDPKYKIIRCDTCGCPIEICTCPKIQGEKE